MRISDWSSDVCSSDLSAFGDDAFHLCRVEIGLGRQICLFDRNRLTIDVEPRQDVHRHRLALGDRRSEEHTSELQSLMRISYAVFCLKKKKKKKSTTYNTTNKATIQTRLNHI